MPPTDKLMVIVERLNTGNEDQAAREQLAADIQKIIDDETRPLRQENARLRQLLVAARTMINRLQVQHEQDEREIEQRRDNDRRLNAELAEARLPRGQALYDYLGDDNFDDGAKPGGKTASGYRPPYSGGVLAPIARDGECEVLLPIAKLAQKFEGRIGRERLRQLMKDGTITPAEFEDGEWSGSPDAVEQYLQKRLAG